MNISFLNEQSKKEFTPEIEEKISMALCTLSHMEELDFCLNVLLTDNRNIARLNSDFRGVDNSTDVLSFPAYELNCPLKNCAQNIVLEYENDTLFIGDIAVSLERASNQANEIGNSYIKEVVFLVVHGALHLLGYDHCDPDKEEIMTKIQREIMDSINL